MIDEYNTLSTPGERLEYFLKKKNLTVPEFAQLIGMKHRGLHSYLPGKQNGKNVSVFGNKYISNLANAGLNYTWYLSGVGVPEVVPPSNLAQPLLLTTDKEKNDILDTSYPIYDLPANALIGCGVAYEDLPHSFTQIQLGMILDRKKIIAFRVLGDSLKDVGICSGNIVLVDRTIKEPSTGKEVVAIHNGLLIVKRYEATPRGEHPFCLYSQNGGKHVYEIADDDTLTIIGVVKVVIQYR